MATIKKGNWANRDPGTDIPDGSVIENGNFAQHTPDTPILVGKTLTINGGNWRNVRKDPAWIINGGNWTQVTLCANLHPDLVQYGLPAEIEACPHSEEIEIIGGETAYHYSDEIMS
jgi:hypothetical protein